MGYAGHGYWRGKQYFLFIFHPFYAGCSGKRRHAHHGHVVEQVVYERRTLKSEYISRARQPGDDLASHAQAGLVVLALVGFRLVWRLASVDPAIVPPLPAWQRRTAHAVEWTFYALMVVLPVLGIVMMQADGKSVSLLGASLPPMVAVDKAWAHRLEDIHEWIGNAMMALIAVHVSAALWHRFVHRDNTLARMW